MTKNNQQKSNMQSEKEDAKQQALFNSVTNSLLPENQNQNHNTKKQALGPNTKR